MLKIAWTPTGGLTRAPDPHALHVPWVHAPSALILRHQTKSAVTPLKSCKVIQYLNEFYVILSYFQPKYQLLFNNMTIYDHDGLSYFHDTGQIFVILFNKTVI